MNRRTFVLGAAAGAAGIFAAAAALYTPPKSAAELAWSAAEKLPLIRNHAPILGPAIAPVTIVEFFDPSCETCRAFHPVLKEILSDFEGEVRVVMRYATLHEGSDEAVRILETARLQGKFEPVLEILLGAQGLWAKHGAPDIEIAWELAGQAGLDVAKAKEKRTAPEIESILRQDDADRRAVGVTKTPTFFVNGKPLIEFGKQQLYDLVSSEIDAL